jgi:alkylation response protein AidB-like acyl-CoA dehydrogenase
MTYVELRERRGSAVEQAAPTREEILARLPAVAQEVAEGAVQRELARELPFDIFRMLRQTGLTWLRVPQALGGPGGTMADQTEIVATLASADSNVAHALRSHFGFVEAIAVDPHGAYSRRYVGEVLNGRLFGGAHMEIGTPRPNMIRTKLVRDGDRFRLSGHKFYATGAIFADYQSFSALDEDGNVTGVLIPTGREGIEILDDWDGMGQSMTASGGVVLKDVVVYPDEVGQRQSGNMFRRRHNATRAQLHLVTVVGGIVRNVLADAIGYTRTRARSAKHSASATAAGDPFVQQNVGDIAALSHVIDVAIADVARRMDIAAAGLVGDAPDIDDLVMASALANSKTQVMVGRLATQAAEKLFDTGGGSATSRQLAFDRHWRNIRTILNHNPAQLRGRVLGDYYLNGVRDDFDEGRVF